MRAGIFALLLGLAFGVQGHDNHGNSLSGVYFGVLGGIGKYTGKPDYSTLNLEVGDNLTGYGAYLGYKVHSNKMTIALEFDYLGYSGELKTGINSEDFHLRAKLNHSYSASILLGYMAAETVEIFMRGGYGKTHIKTRVGSASNPTERTGSFRMPVGGLGVRFSNESSIGLRFEFRHYFNKTYEIADGTDFKSSGNLLLASLDYLF